MHKLIGAAVATVAFVGVAPAAHAAPAPAGTKITFSVSTKATGEVSLKGALSATGATVPAGRKLVVETRRAGTAKWYAFPASFGKAPATAAGGAFTASYTSVMFPHGYYRVRFAGDAELAAARSATVRDKRINSLVFGWKVSPRKIRKGSYVTFSGVLKHDPVRAYVPYQGRKIMIIGRARGTKTWYWYAQPRTDAKGRFTARLRVTRDFYFAYHYKGDATHYMDAPPKNVFVDVR
ncbi:hypothetical protein [Actinomadura kijaniata]|uniref:hypothetical protein n=1 Tax=Actinomadura kijaniata TaxID=46161 RepID=UPI0008375139|nr:hypothetical protein [Actinomadura kijaniata]